MGSPIRYIVATSFVVFTLSACGTSVGAACTTPGSTNQCGSDAVCDADSQLGTVCLELCKQDSDCASGEQCTGVTGALKACHSK
jgi:hypothetical protein